MNSERLLRLAVWSGPRNISTALLRSWGNRTDTFVCDEPLYGQYLRTTGLRHPGAEEVIAAQEHDVHKVVAWLTGAIPGGKTIFYQKHMAHHLLPSIERSWLQHLEHAFLIRDPREMLTSLVKILPEPTLADTGLPQQVEIFREVRDRTGSIPPVIDSRDVLENPRGMLTRFCAAVGVPFQENMMQWRPGRRETDGVWAKHWYGAVERSTGFKPFVPKPDPIPSGMEGLYESCLELHRELHDHRLAAAPSAPPAPPVESRGEE